MKKPIMLQLCIIFLLSLNIVKAASIIIDAPSYIVQSEGINVNFSVNSTQSFSGTVYLLYTNVNSSISSVSFSSSGFAGDYYNYTWSIKGMQPGAFSIFANLTNSSGETLATLNKTGNVNSSMPRVISSSPSGIVNKESTVLTVSTNEIATCKYSTTNNSYENLSNTFSNTGGTSHNQSLSGLSQGEHIFYIRCEDSAGYKMNESAVIKFTVDLPPSAQILLSDTSPVKEGTIEITLTASESLDNAPTLEYSFNDAPSARRQVALTGSSSSWKGYLIITELDNDKIGAFYFSATDNAGNSGTKITSGNIFVVDTKAPSAPQSLKAASGADGSIKISWYYAGEEADYFKIYRATTPGIEYVDFYDESDESNGSQAFIDTSTIDKVTYYYRISTVDKSGNEGPLSEEIFATSVISGTAASSSTPSIATESETSNVPKVLPPNLVPRVDVYIKKIDSLIIDAKDISIQLGEKEGEKADLIRELKLVEQANAAKSKLESLKSQLEGFKSSYATEEELGQKLNAIDLESKKIERTTPKDATVVEKSEFLQSTSNEDIEKAANELFKDISFTDAEKNEYIRKNEKEKDKINVNVLAKVVSTVFLDGTKEEITIVRKKLSYQGKSSLNDVLVIETIPKTVAQVNEVEFPDQKYEILGEDAVKFGFLKFSADGEAFSYSIRKKINIEDVKNTKAVLLLSLSEIAKPSSKVTGLSVFSLGKFGLTKVQAIFVSIGVLAIISLSAYYFLLVKDYKYIFKKLHRAIKIRRADSLNSEPAGFPELPLPGKMPEKSALQMPDENAKLLHELYLNIRDAKAGMADSLLPLFFTLNNKLESKGFSGKGTYYSNAALVNALIDQAHKYLDDELHAEAVKLYPKISFMYQNLPKESRAEIYSRCAHLHRRIDSLKPVF